MMNGIPFWYGMGKAAAMGAISGAISFGIGSAVTSTATSFIGKAALQAALHGYSGGVMSALEGGNFMSGFAAGAVSSIISSAIQASGTNFKGTGAVQDINRNYTSLNSFGKSGLHKVVMIAAGGLSGGFSSAIAGGNFWQGVKQGIITSGLNHATNHVVEELQNGGKNESMKNDDDPKKPTNKKITFKQAREHFLNGTGETLYTDIQAMGVELHESDFDTDGIARINFDQEGFNGIDNALVHGSVQFERVEGSPKYAQVRFNERLNCRCGLYDFEQHPNDYGRKAWNNPKVALRNWATVNGSLINSRFTSGGSFVTGKPFSIQYTNVVKILP
jgi:hypothetical protein